MPWRTYAAPNFSAHSHLLPSGFLPLSSHVGMLAMAWACLPWRRSLASLPAEEGREREEPLIFSCIFSCHFLRFQGINIRFPLIVTSKHPRIPFPTFEPERV